MKVIITGASSYVGARFYSDMRNKYEVIGTYNSNKLFPELEHLDITKKEEVMKFILEKKPDFIIHVAANASGSWCDKNPQQAVAINELGTKYIVEGANRVDAKVIFISSVFANYANQLYGRTKLKSEEYVKKTNAGYVILRPSLIMGYSPNTINDRPFNRLLKNITQKTPAVYDTSWKFQPTWLSHLEEIAELVIDKNILNQTIPVSTPELKTRFDIANDVLIEFGISVVPEDKQDATPDFADDQEKLRELHLPIYTYLEMIDGLKQEIKDYLSNK
ncbi:MAG: sugar nucleotide-binding protein [Candidatus Nanoarchaeia archaeon]